MPPISTIFSLLGFLLNSIFIYQTIAPYFRKIQIFQTHILCQVYIDNHAHNSNCQTAEREEQRGWGKLEISWQYYFNTVMSPTCTTFFNFRVLVFTFYNKIKMSDPGFDGLSTVLSLARHFAMQTNVHTNTIWYMLEIPIILDMA